MKRILLVLAALLAIGGEAQAQCSGQPNANTVCAGPGSGGPGPATFRPMVAADLASASITVNTTPIIGGTDGRIVYQGAGKFSQFIVGGDCTFSAPNFTCTKTQGVSLANPGSAVTDTTNAANIGSGLLANARLTSGFINAGLGLTGGALAGGGSIAIDKATTANFAAAASNKVLTADGVFTSEVPITYGTTTTFDFSTFINGAVTLTGNVTTITFSNVKAGQAGMLRFIQDSTGSRTIPATINSTLKCPGGCSYVLTTTANAVDGIGYTCISATYCIGGSLLKDIK